MIDDDDRKPVEPPTDDRTVARECKEPHPERGRQEAWPAPERDAHRRADLSLRATQAADALLKVDAPPIADLDRGRATADRLEHDGRPGDPTDRFHPAAECLNPEYPPTADRWRQEGYAEKTVKDFPPLPEDGSKVWFHREGCAWLSREGTVTVETKLADPGDRQGFEGFLPTATEQGLKHHYERAHAQGAGTGVESPYGLALAPQEVNQELQNQGVEAFIRELHAHKRDDIDLYLRTEVQTDRTGLYLERIHYVLEAAPHTEGFVENRGERALLLAASIEVTGPRDHPRAKWEADDSAHSFDRIGAILQPAPDTEARRQQRR